MDFGFRTVGGRAGLSLRRKPRGFTRTSLQPSPTPEATLTKLTIIDECTQRVDHDGGDRRATNSTITFRKPLVIRGFGPGAEHIDVTWCLCSTRHKKYRSIGPGATILVFLRRAGLPVDLADCSLWPQRHFPLTSL